MSSPGRNRQIDSSWKRSAPRKLAKESHIEEVKALKSSVDSARWDLKLRSDRVPLLEQSIAMRQDRLKGPIEAWPQSGMSPAPFCSRPKAKYWMYRTVGKKH